MPNSDHIKRLLTKDANGLLPCECGHEARLVDADCLVFMSECTKCSLKNVEGFCIPDDAKYAWNNRASIPIIRELLEVIAKQSELFNLVLSTEPNYLSRVNNVATLGASFGQPYVKLWEELKG